MNTHTTRPRSPFRSLHSPHTRTRPDALRQARRAHGMTMIDSLIVVSILGILIATAIPSFQTAMKSQRAQRTADEIAITIQHARSEAVTRNRQVSVAAVQSADGGTCHIVFDGERDDCRCESPAPVCTAGTQLIAGGYVASNTGVRVTANAVVRMNPRNGTATPTGTFRIATDDGIEIQQRVNVTGRVRGCTRTPQRVSGVPPCPA
jgi:type IV fimbrial biogenesis protein FimT